VVFPEKWISGSHRNRRISRIAEQLLASQGRLVYMDVYLQKMGPSALEGLRDVVTKATRIVELLCFVQAEAVPVLN
jgi:hypothetical protein